MKSKLQSIFLDWLVGGSWTEKRWWFDVTGMVEKYWGLMTGQENIHIADAWHLTER